MTTRSDYQIDESLWGQDLDFSLPEHTTREAITGYVLYYLEIYKSRHLRGHDLWTNFHQDFDEWTENILFIAHRQVLKEMIGYMRANGVWIRTWKSGTSFAKLLAECLNETTPHVPTAEQLEELTDQERIAYFPPRTPSIPEELLRPEHAPLPPSPRPTQRQGTPEMTEPNRIPIPRIQRPSVQPPERLPSEDWYQNQSRNPSAPNRSGPPPAPTDRYRQVFPDRTRYPAPPVGRYPSPPAGRYPPSPVNRYLPVPGRYPSSPINHYAPPPADNRPPQPPAPANVSSRLLTDLMKVYSNDDKKYGGEEYDILDTKLKKFYECCSRIGLQPDQYQLAFSTILKGRAEEFYFAHIYGKSYDFPTIVKMTKVHFETDETHQKYLTEWRQTSLARTIAENPGKSRLECFQLIIDKLQKIQPGLDASYQSDRNLRDQLLNACQGIPECQPALFQPSLTFQGLCAGIRSAILTTTQRHMPAYITDSSANSYASLDTDPKSDGHPSQFWVDRVYGGSSHKGKDEVKTSSDTRGGQSHNDHPHRGGTRGGKFDKSKQSDQRCYVCHKRGCYSTKHTMAERREAYRRYKDQRAYTTDTETTPAEYGSFLAYYEGMEGLDDSPEQKPDHAQFTTMTLENAPHTTFMTELGSIDGAKLVSILQDQVAYHAFTKNDKFQPTKVQDSSTFTFDRYSSDKFQGIMPDSGAAGISSVGESQFLALQKEYPHIKLDVSSSGANRIKFGKGTAIAKGTVRVPTPLGEITFHVVPTNTPFLMCLQDMDALGVRFDNLRNLLIQGNKIIPIVRKWGHPWMLLNSNEEVLAWNHLTEVELRQLHRRFGHPSVQRFIKVLERSGHDTNFEAIKKLTELCHQCQMHGKSPGRFKFTLKDDVDFNHSVVIDVFYLDGAPVLHVVDSATGFGAARFLNDISTHTTWEVLRACWIDTYLGPPDQVVHDAGKNFASTEFKQYAKSMAIDVKEVLVEAHNSVGLVERYHAPLRRAYQTISNGLAGESVSKDAILQMAVKAVNDTAGPEGLVPTLLVFGAYPRMAESDPPSVGIVKRAKAIKSAMKELRRLQAERQVQDALAMRNGPNTQPTLDLPLQSDVKVWREKGGWQGPFKLFAISGETCTLDMPHGPTNFRSTVVKPYYQDPDVSKPDFKDSGGDDSTLPDEETHPIDQPAKRGRGRPKGSKNIQRTEAGHVTDLSTALCTTHSEDDDFDEIDLELPTEAFITRKKQADKALSLELRQKGVITTAGAPFQESQQQEIDSLIAKGVFEFVRYNPAEHSKVRIFNSRLVNEVKGKTTALPYEKSRLVIQAYNDAEKGLVLTQSPTIQRASQRLIIALAPALAQLGINLFLRDITQAYVQSTTSLNRLILARLPKEMQNQYSSGTIMIVRKPLYGIPKAGTHWWATYYRHHKDKLSMTVSTYDPCLLITTHKEAFGIVGMQTDDTLFLGSEKFANLEDDELQKAGLVAKPRDRLQTDSNLVFNGCILTHSIDGIMTIKQKDQGKKLQLIDKTSDFKTQYVEQRARGAYIASICQPEAQFDLSVAAQHQDPTVEDVKTLNKRIQWQMDHLDRGLQYVPLALESAKLYVFVDGSFANNQDLSSQIGYLIILANETKSEQTFTLRGNLVHYSSTKSKRVTRSVLASEIYGMVGGVDMGIAIGTTLKIITDQLALPQIPIIVCTDSYSLYECLVKLGTTKEKRLMIDIMALRQSYERREIMEMRWINGKDNLADAMTKGASNKALETFVDTNEWQIRVEGWVERKETEE